MIARYDRMKWPIYGVFMPVPVPQRPSHTPFAESGIPAVVLAVVAGLVVMAIVLKAEVYAQSIIPPDALEFAALTDAE